MFRAGASTSWAEACLTAAAFEETLLLGQCGCRSWQHHSDNTYHQTVIIVDIIAVNIVNKQNKNKIAGKIQVSNLQSPDPPVIN